jgi:hypothetical protein
LRRGGRRHDQGEGDGKAESAADQHERAFYLQSRDRPDSGNRHSSRGTGDVMNEPVDAILLGVV